MIAVILATAFLGLDALGDEREQPFATTSNGLPLDALVRAVELVVVETPEGFRGAAPR